MVEEPNEHDKADHWYCACTYMKFVVIGISEVARIQELCWHIRALPEAKQRAPQKLFS